MNKIYYLIVLMLGFTFISCTSDENDVYVEIPIAETPVSVNLTQVPYSKLSDYHFFKDELKNHQPTTGVLPYEPASSLFADYAHKMRFIWLPNGTTAAYNGDDNVFEFPVGTALLKTFYYDNVQPNNTRKIIETRLLIRKQDGWKAYDYIWNTAQTEAFLDTVEQGVFIPIEWKENGITKTTTYKTPSQTECLTCHKINPNQTTGGEITIPIGPKPQNLNKNFNYSTGSQNQIAKWKSVGFIGNDVPNTSTIYSTVDWNDTSKTLEQRARSYIDVNCAHCHRTGGHCDYVSMRFNFSNTNLDTFGVCMTPLFYIENGPFVINGGDANHSELIHRINTTEGATMMPIIGRTIIHNEGVQLISDWINSLPADCH
jgi:uncharacterized repeat protein (TIGR03806 family)